MGLGKDLSGALARGMGFLLMEAEGLLQLLLLLTHLSFWDICLSWFPH